MLLPIYSVGIFLFGEHMKIKLFKLSGMVFLLSTSAAASFMPYGVKVNTPVSVVQDLWGWSECFVTPGTSDGTAISTIISSCSEGNSLMMAIRQVGSDVFDILGAANIETVSKYTPLPFHTDTLTGNDQNGLSWYLNEWSWGFTEQGNTVDQYTADTNLYYQPWGGNSADTTYNNIGLSYHTSETTLDSGWAFNNGIFNLLSTSYERVWLFSDALSAPQPGSLILLGLALVGFSYYRAKMVS